MKTGRQAQRVDREHLFQSFAQAGSPAIFSILPMPSSACSNSRLAPVPQDLAAGASQARAVPRFVRLSSRIVSMSAG